MTDLEPLIVAAAKAGQDFHIPAGTYPPFYLRGAVAPKPITITSDPRVVLSMVSQNSSGLTFSGLEFAVDPKQGKAVAIQGGSDLHFDRCNIHGAKAGDGAGATFSDCPNSSVTNCELHHLGSGLGVKQSDHFIASGNRLHDIEVDGFQFNATSFITVDSNTGSDFYPVAGDHADFCQFQTSGQTAPATDIAITNNTYTRGEGADWMQGIFMGNESGQPYQRVTILGNALIGGFYHGITLDTADTFEIGHNLVVGFADQAGQPWIMDESCSNGSVHDNAAVGYVPKTPGANVTRANNATVPAIATVGDLSMLKAFRALPADPPPVTVDPRDAQIADLNARLAALRQAFANIVKLAQASNAKRVGPTKADNTAILAIAQPLAK
jgi:hypothetical protein